MSTPAPAVAPALPPVAVSISTRDRADAVGRCLDALLAGELLPAEIVVVDQSRDAATEAVVAARAGGPVPVRYVRHAGSGLGASQNVGFRAAEAPVVAVTDDDCIAAPEWLRTVAEAFAASPSLGAVTGPVLPLGPPRPGFTPVSSRPSLAPRRFDGRSVPWDVGSGNNFAVRREWLERIGGNDERLGPGSPGLGGVDMDLFYRLLRAGATIAYEPAAIVYHELASQRDRLARRRPYGHGMGAACALWLRQGDAYGLRVLAAWLGLRGRRLLGGLRRREWRLVYEELLVLEGTLRGLLHGARVATPPAAG